jgi:hypothetical protein
MGSFFFGGGQSLFLLIILKMRIGSLTVFILTVFLAGCMEAKHVRKISRITGEYHTSAFYIKDRTNDSLQDHTAAFMQSRYFCKSIAISYDGKFAGPVLHLFSCNDASAYDFEISGYSLPDGSYFLDGRNLFLNPYRFHKPADETDVFQSSLAWKIVKRTKTRLVIRNDYLDAEWHLQKR